VAEALVAACGAVDCVRFAPLATAVAALLATLVAAATALRVARIQRDTALKLDHGEHGVLRCA
jgi:hypothetical protein